MPENSKGHVEYIGPWEYLRGDDGNLYRAPKSNPLDIHGYRQGARWECYAYGAELCLKLARQAFAE